MAAAESMGGPTFAATKTNAGQVEFGSQECNYYLVVQITVRHIINWKTLIYGSGGVLADNSTVLWFFLMPVY